MTDQARDKLMVKGAAGSPRDELTVKPVAVKKKKERPPLGAALFPDLYCSVYICAGTKSGKTTLINHILEYCIDDRTHVYIYCPTVEIDPTYAYIIERLAARDIKTTAVMHYLDDSDHNVLDDTMKELFKKGEPEQHGSGRLLGKRIVGGAVIEVYHRDTLQPDMPPPKYSAPKNLFLFDDLAEDMRAPIVYSLLKVQRHFKAKTLISTQSVKDLMPKAIKQLFYCIVFGGQTDAVLKDLYEALAMRAVTLAQFMQFYRAATAKKYDFLYIDIRRVIFKRCFTDVLYAK
jgi:hypothetical protein